MSDYISKSALRQEILDKLPQGGSRGVFLAFVDDAQVFDEKEVIIKTVERIISRLEEEMPISWKQDYAGGKKDAFVEAITICKEEGGIE